MNDLTKTTIFLKASTGTYPIYYCEITERYFIKRHGRLLEVAYERGQWKGTGVQMPKNLKGREYQ